ncbi:hypothetical protein T492DRAFT_475002 [Pavlovales sp. CCMP2436]|nr:hypothetical protein T492DRAFT_475002 [Pavlovales sp. CCMP2436]
MAGTLVAITPGSNTCVSCARIFAARIKAASTLIQNTGTSIHALGPAGVEPEVTSLGCTAPATASSVRMNEHPHGRRENGKPRPSMRAPTGQRGQRMRAVPWQRSGEGAATATHSRSRRDGSMCAVCYAVTHPKAPMKRDLQTKEARCSPGSRRS